MHNLKKYAGVVVVDAESLACCDDAVALSYAMAFHPMEYLNSIDDIKSVEFKLDAKQQMKELNKVVDPECLTWWKEQSKEAQQILVPKPDDHKLEELANLLVDWTKNECGVKLYDCLVLDRRCLDTRLIDYNQNFTFKNKWPAVFYYRNVKELSTTLFWLVGNDWGTVGFDEYPNLVQHVAKDDCIMDMIRFMEAMKLHNLLD